MAETCVQLHGNLKIVNIMATFHQDRSQIIEFVNFRFENCIYFFFGINAVINLNKFNMYIKVNSFSKNFNKALFQNYLNERNYNSFLTNLQVLINHYWRTVRNNVVEIM